MVKDVLRYYISVAWSIRKYSLLPVFLSPIARIGLDYIPPLMVAAIIDRLSNDQKPQFGSLLWYVIGYVAIPFGTELIWRVILWFIFRAEAYGMEKIANDTFNDLIHRSYDFHVNNFAGALVAKVGRFINGFEALYDVLTYQVFGVLSGIIFATVVLFIRSRGVGIAFIIILIIYCAIIYRLTVYRFGLNKIRAKAESKMSGQLADSLTNAITTKIFAKEQFEFSLFKKITRDVAKKRIKSWDYQNIPMDLFTSNTIIALNGIALAGSVYAVYRLGASVGSVFLLVTYINSLTNRFFDFSRVMRTTEKTLSDASEMMHIIKQEKSVLDQEGSISLKNVQGELTLSKVSFTYIGKNESKLFENLNLTIPAGQNVGIVGPSGGGKTTITKLLLRFMDIRSGAIKIDGINIAEVTQTSLRDAITYVPQEPLLFHRSIKENIAYGKPSATMKEITTAAKKAHAHDFIEKLPQGYDTLVGERGIKLSGGQRQRVALARAILKDAPIIVLDEATSALDSESERLIQEALFSLMEGRTTIVIAHRLSTIKHLDRILVLKDGKIIEDGNHVDLIKKKNGTYAKLWSHQSGGFIE